MLVPSAVNIENTIACAAPAVEPDWLRYLPLATLVVAAIAFVAWQTARMTLVRDTRIQLAEIIEVLTLDDVKMARVAFSKLDHSWQHTGHADTTVDDLMPHYFVLLGAVEQAKLRFDALRRARLCPWWVRTTPIDRDAKELVGWNLTIALAWLKLARNTVFDGLDFRSSDRARTICKNAFEDWSYIDPGDVDALYTKWKSAGDFRRQIQSPARTSNEIDIDLLLGKLRILVGGAHDENDQQLADRAARRIEEISAAARASRDGLRGP